VTQLAYDTRRGVNSRDLERRKKSMQDHGAGKWQTNERDLPAGVSDKLEKAFISGELRCGVWDNGMLREFDLAKMAEVPGLRQLRRVGLPAYARNAV
jgi:hypothetical protein